MKIRKSAIEEFKQSIGIVQSDSPIGILGGVIYLLYLNHIKIGWRELREKIEFLIKNSLHKSAYACFKDIALDSYLEDFFTISIKRSLPTALPVGLFGFTSTTMFGFSEAISSLKAL